MLVSQATQLADVILQMILDEDAVIYRKDFYNKVKTEVETRVQWVNCKCHDTIGYDTLQTNAFCEKCGSNFPNNVITKCCPNCGRQVIYEEGGAE